MRVESFSSGIAGAGLVAFVVFDGEVEVGGGDVAGLDGWGILVWGSLGRGRGLWLERRILRIER